MRPRAIALAASLLAMAVGSGGCIAIKDQVATQRLPGVVTLRVTVCVSDRDQSTYSGCIPGTNTAENDNGLEGDQSGSGRGQMLVGFRVPDGTVAPNSFQSEGGRVNFAKSPTYTEKLRTVYAAPPAGFHWEGYISTELPFDPAIGTDRQTVFSPEFGLPAGANGAPFAGPFRWRVVVGFRRTSSAGSPNPGDPVACVFPDICFDSPLAGNATAHLTKAVSDFGVLKGADTTVGQGETARASFLVRNVDGGALGARTVALSAATTLPSTTAAPASNSLAVPANATSTSVVSVAIPPGTPLGTYTVTLSAVDNSAPPGQPVTRSNTVTVTVVDKVAPAVRIGSPPQGATFTQGQTVVADYGCTDEANGSGVATCAGPVAPGAAIDTSSVGQKTFTVNAADVAGNPATLSRTYTVVPPTPPTTIVVAPKPEQINVSIGFLFSASRKFTTLNPFQVKNVAAGATVTAKCKGKGCPTRKVKGKRKAISFTKKNAFNVVTLKPWVKKRLPVGTVITITVTKPKAFGMVKKLVIRRSKAPKIVTTCLQPDSKASAPCAT